MDIYAKIKAGHYEPNVKYPTRPQEPAVLRKLAGQLTGGETGLIGTVRSRYEQAMADYQDAQAAYRKAETEARQRFRADLEEENGTGPNPKADLIFQKAWDRGHAGGYHDVANVYNDLVELIFD